MTHGPADWWVFRARPDSRSRYRLGVLDGDTYELVVDTGFHSYRRVRMRALGVDTAEIFGATEGSDEYERGVEQRDWVRQWFDAAASTAEAVEEHPPDWPVTIQTRRQTGKYGRWLADVFDAEGASLTDDLVAAFGDEVRGD